MKKQFWITWFILLCSVFNLSAEDYEPQFSTAGFYVLPHTGRSVSNMNPAWRFHKGKIAGAESVAFDDANWERVSLPHGIELLPSEASGCVNYQGEVWYRKHFVPSENWKGKKLFLHFEAIMGKSKVWVNGQLMTEHYGGFLPVIVDVSSALHFGTDNVIAVWADNSDDPSYPPGKSQDVLDFTYCGGIYRDCWMIVHDSVFLTDANYENEKAGGGLFVSYDQVSERSAVINLKAHVRNASEKKFAGRLVYELYDKEGKKVLDASQPLQVRSKEAVHLKNSLVLKRPHLWQPDSPYLYQLHVLVKNRRGEVVDGYRRRIGVRSIEFKAEEGFWLNGKPYEEPLIGANRHQDFAVIGNALPNSLHWRDAKKLRDAGLRVIRNAHYPQDPSFMDACDEFGLFVIVNTPGWQFWNEAPSFAEFVYQDIRNMVRRDRNHASVWMWEPILNETWYPADFAKNVKDLIHEEYPYPYGYAACDDTARGHEHYQVRFSHPFDKNGKPMAQEKGVTYFTREWGDNVDDWNSHNSPSRVHRAWGEIPMLIQAQGYAKPDYPYTCYDALYRTNRQHIGGCLWHSFDHQRGYHPDPFYGGIMDAFRQPKISYYLFQAQRPPFDNPELAAESGPMVHIAHIMSPFSPADVTVYSNCEEVRLTDGVHNKTYTYQKAPDSQGMPSPVITFPGIFNVMDDKKLARSGKHQESFLLAEGLMDGKVVASHKVYPSRRPSKLLLWLDNEGVGMKADGSDKVVVVAAVSDAQGNIKRLNNYTLRFELEGPGKLVGDASTCTNPRPVQWGTAPILVEASTEPGTIKVKASVILEGKQVPMCAEIEIPVAAASLPIIANPADLALLKETRYETSAIRTVDLSVKKDMQAKLQEVERQQTEFE